MPKMDPEKVLRILKEVQADKTPVTLHLNMGDVFGAVMALQMVARNWDKLDALGEQKAYLTWLARQLQEGLLQFYPEAHEYLEAGWYPEEDQE